MMGAIGLCVLLAAGIDSSRARGAPRVGSERPDAKAPYSVVIPAFNAERTIGAVLLALARQEHPPAETIVVDDLSVDRTGSAAEAGGAHVIRGERRRHAGGARNRGWAAATTDTVVFLDADAIPSDTWSAGLRRALDEFPGAVIGCARSFAPHSHWGWVSHLQTETPYL